MTTQHKTTAPQELNIFPATIIETSILDTARPRAQLWQPPTEPLNFDVVLCTLEGGRRMANVPRTTRFYDADGYDWGVNSPQTHELALNILNAFVPPHTDNRSPVSKPDGKISATAVAQAELFAAHFLYTAGPEVTIRADQILRWLASHGVVVSVPAIQQATKPLTPDRDLTAILRKHFADSPTTPPVLAKYFPIIQTLITNVLHKDSSAQLTRSIVDRLIRQLTDDGYTADAERLSDAIAHVH